jgi:hypothetical protein
MVFEDGVCARSTVRVVRYVFYLDLSWKEKMPRVSEAWLILQAISTMKSGLRLGCIGSPSRKCPSKFFSVSIKPNRVGF